MATSIFQQAEKLTLDEKIRLAGCLEGLIAKERAAIADAGFVPGHCPHCGSGRIVRAGHGRDGSQRWRCNGCGRTFSARTMGLLGYSKLGPEVWARFVRCELSGCSLRRDAEMCHVCLKTAWFMRIRLCEAMERCLPEFRHGESVSVEADGTYLSESLKGNRSRSRTKMPREAHSSGHCVHSRGLSREKVCIACAANSLGDCHLQVCSRGVPTDAELADALRGIVEGSPVATDGCQGYSRVLPGLGAAHIRPEAAGTHGRLGMVNALHQRLKGWAQRFHGVSTRWLDHYLAWFSWMEMARHSDMDAEEMLSGQAAHGHYGLTRAEAISRSQPFWGYWEGRDLSSVSTLV
jgi:transposase-like protein